MGLNPMWSICTNRLYRVCYIKRKGDYLKKLMILGGSRYALPIIKTAHDLGFYVITCDYLPDNFAHRYSDEYHNVSIVDMDAVYEDAYRSNIDGIMSFACDPGVVTAAYVAEKMGLPSVGSYEAVSILQNKGLFRRYLSDNGFNVPIARSYSCYEDAQKELDIFQWPVMVKPVDSAGSKGVKKVDEKNQLKESFEYALSFSKSKKVIIEDYLEQKGFSSDTDSFSINGVMKMVTFNCQRFDKKASNPYTPAAYSWPSSMSIEHQNELKNEIQRLVTLLNLGTSIYNIETRECINGNAYIMECSPRGGGNRLAECIKLATGVDLLKASVLAAMGGQVTDVDQKPYTGNWAEVILHGDCCGIFKGLKVSSELDNYLVETDLWINKGDLIHSFNGANDAIGTMVYCFDDKETMERVLLNQNEYISVDVV